MHRLIVILLILLVPVRVFGAESMGICMHDAGQQQEVSSMPDDCPMLAKSGAPATPEKKTNGSGCESCQLCMPLAAPDNAAAICASRPDRDVPAARLIAFRSADIPHALKPPIA